MIVKILDGYSILTTPEDADDLLNLRRVIKKDDKVTSDTTRVIKRERDFSRPDRGERVRIRITLDVEKINLDSVLDKLRISGTIVKSNNESIPLSSHHSFVIKINDSLVISKKRWSFVEKKIIQSRDEKFGFVLVAVDTRDCGIGRLKGTHLQIMPNIYSGFGGKRYKTSFNIENFFQEITQAVSSIIKSEDHLVIFGPGETKKKFANHLAKSNLNKFKYQIIEGIDLGGEDGILIFTKSGIMKEILSGSKLSKASSIIDEVMIRANKKSRKFTMGFEETKKANEYGAVESLVFSEKLIQNFDEDKIIDFLNVVEENGVKTYSVDSTTDLGLRVNNLGGVVSLLRFAVS